LAEKHGLELSGLMSFLYWGANAASADTTMRAKAAKILHRQIECAQILGIDTILAVPGAVGVDFIPGAEVVRYDTAYERATEFLKTALPLAEKAGVTIAVENVWNKFLLSPLEMRAFVDQFGSSHVGVYFDVANTMAFGYPEHWIEILGSRIKRVHFKDYRRNVATVDGFCDLLSGDVDWPAVMAALRKVGYEGWVAAEMIPPVPFYKHAPEVLIHNTSRAMDAIFSL
jgi:hexulose-6-phosphate isomerase